MTQVLSWHNTGNFTTRLADPGGFPCGTSWAAGDGLRHVCGGPGAPPAGVAHYAVHQGSVSLSSSSSAMLEFTSSMFGFTESTSFMPWRRCNRTKFAARLFKSSSTSL